MSVCYLTINLYAFEDVGSKILIVLNILIIVEAIFMQEKQPYIFKNKLDSKIIISICLI